MKIEKLREVVGKMTDGPWSALTGSGSDTWGIYPKNGAGRILETVRYPKMKQDADGIAAMRNHIDALLDVAERARHQVNGTWLHFCGPSEVCNCEHRDLREALAKLESTGSGE